MGTATPFLGDVRIATTVRQRNGNRAIGTRASREVVDATVENGKPWVGPAFVVKDWYLTAYDPLRDLDGKIVGMLYVRRLQQSFKDLARSFLIRYAMLFVFGVLSSLILAFFIAAHLAHPIHRLVEAVECINRGERNIHVEVRSSCREIGALV